MDKKTLTELDYYRIRDVIAGFCVAEESRFIMGRLEPFADKEEIEERKNLSREWLKYLNTTRSPALSGWNPVYNIFKAVSVEGAGISLEQTKDLGS